MVLQILDPTAPPSAPTARPRSGSESVAGRRVAVLDNGWSSMRIIADHMATLLRERYGAARVLYERIPVAVAAPDQQLRRIAAEADFAIVGLAN